MSTSRVRGAVVVGVDVMPSSRLALAWAADEAALRRLPLHVVLPVEAPELEGGSAELTSLWESWGLAARTAYAAVLEEERDFAIERHPGLTVVAELADGAPADVLRARAPGSSMVVIGARRGGGVQGLLSSESVGKPLVTQAACPIVVVREPEPVTPAPPHVVVGVDGSALSSNAVRFAFEEAAFREARLIAVSAWQPSHLHSVSSEGVEDEVRRVLVESTAGWQEEYPEVELKHAVVRGHPVRVLSDAAEWAALLVVGSRGLGGFSGLLLGSVSQGLVHHARCPLLIVPHPAGDPGD